MEREKRSKFSKDVYKISLYNNKEHFIVTYKGDKSDFKNMPHGNSKSENLCFERHKIKSNENPTSF